MEERFGARGTTTDGVFFTEDAIENVQSIQHIRVEISRQNSNLAAIKARMAAQAKAMGATAIMNFVYGQKAHKGLKLFIPKWDTESWHGEGEAVKA
jgi:uncharacterized protein YbjQ (UPF0145 family)